jgi:hypothetical protein
MRAYDPAAWVPFFTAMIAAAAGLAGLLFVAVSINLDKIVDRFPDGGHRRGDRSVYRGRLLARPA